ncbi:UV-stimulated scaffold protein A isoform X1 [Sciurus carolinensis]|uniref:UV-stimulated scaffold protein A isoform X1 n=3 Tax=Sciurus carolinensis TaxID=30640 RepID=UPI001FB41E43|nr:UV-stimulated scaffold protein A isoform X1 [Sciurus carolinensis]
MSRVRLGVDTSDCHQRRLTHSNNMDQKLSKLVEELTTSGEPQLNPEKMKELKKICKSSEEQLGHAYRLLKTQLTQDHAEVRLSAFQIMDELFTRSHQFRVLLVSDFQEFLELTLGTDHEQPLPPPREAAQRLRQAAMRAVEGWNERFGEAYKKLALGYHFLKHTKKVDFQDVNCRTLVERRREEQKQKHLDKIYSERAKQAEREMEEMSAEIGCCLTEVENCFRLLVPLNFDPCPEASFLDEGSPGSLSSHLAVPHWSGTPDAPDEPCCSKDLPASAHQPGTAGAGEGLPQAAKWDPVEDEEQPCCSKDLPASAHHPGSTGTGKRPPQAATEDTAEDEQSDWEQFVRSHGLGSHKYSLDVELPLDGLKVQENEDNLAVLHAARDALKLIRNKFLPTVCSWVQRLTRAGTHDGHLKRAIDLKTELECTLRKYEELDIEPEGGRRSKTEDGEDEDDEDFVEVPEKEGYEPHIPGHLRAEYGLEPKAPLQTVEKDAAAQDLQARMRMRTRRDEEASDPTSAAAQLWRLQDHLPPVLPSSVGAATGPEEAQKLAAERARAPIVPFGVDLCYWGQEQPATGWILKSDSQHRFWRPSEVEEEVESADVSAMLRSRRIAFAGKFEPVQHRCRALRPDGRLCERQDRLKCPFHGRIIPRDDEGRPLDPEDRAREQQQPPQKQAHPDWQDPEFMKDVEAATGADLGSSRYSRKGRGTKKKHPKLTDLRERANTSRARLRKKVFAKAAVQRVVTAMNQMDQKKHEKFANQFNYALN